MKQQFLSNLKKELQNSFGRKIVSSRDCIQMVEDIYRRTGETVNSNTLRRFFGLVKAEYPPSSSTLTILAKYCGFNSVNEIERLAVKEDAEESINKEEVLRYLVSLFKNTQVAGYQERTFYPLVEQTVVFLERNPTLIDRFHREIAKTATGQYYYYEKLANIDRLNGYYGDGLRHYLVSKNTDDARVFAHSLQVFRFWLTKNKESLLQHVAELPRSYVEPTYPPHILGRLIAARLYNANVLGLPIEPILAEAKRYHGAIIARREDAPFSFPDFELIICEALMLTGNYDEGLEYIWHGKNFLSTSGQYQTTLFNLWEDFVSARRGTKAKTKKSADSKLANISAFPSQKFNSIIKLLSGNLSKNKASADNQQLNDLIRDTGYKKLSALLL